jgi:hypothetical protein
VLSSDTYTNFEPSDSTFIPTTLRVEWFETKTLWRRFGNPAILDILLDLNVTSLIVTLDPLMETAPLSISNQQINTQLFFFSLKTHFFSLLISNQQTNKQIIHFSKHTLESGLFNRPIATNNNQSRSRMFQTTHAIISIAQHIRCSLKTSNLQIRTHNKKFQ